jgi:hypothetical protein
MSRSYWVDDGGKIVPRSLFEPLDFKYRPNSCKVCDDTGVIIETIDEERYDVTTHCWKCRVFCEACNKHVKKSGHECPQEEI